MVPISGTSPTITPVGTPINTAGDWNQKYEVDFVGAGSAYLYYHLRLTDTAGECNGSSQNSQLVNPTDTGDFKNIGQQTVPVPANDVLQNPSIEVLKYIPDGNGWKLAPDDTWKFCGDLVSLLGDVACRNNGSAVWPEVTATTTGTNITFTEEQLIGSNYVFDHVGGTNCVASGSTAVATVKADFDSPQNAVCEFYNTLKPGTIKIKKITEGGVGTFNFTSDPDLPGTTAPDGSFTLTTTLPSSMAMRTFSNVAPGRYFVNETPLPSGWSFASLTCSDENDPSGGSRVLGSLAEINLQPDETVTCTYTNKKDAKVRIVKEANPESDTEFEFALTNFGGDTGLKLVDNGTDDNFADYTFGNGQFNTKTIKELVPAGWTLTTASCRGVSYDYDTVNDRVSFAVVPGADITCTFSNTKDGAIQLVKNTTGGDATFPFTHSIAGLAPSLTTVSGTAADTSDSLTPGSGYAISEGDLPAGWAFTSAACELQGGGTTGTVTGKNITAITVEAGKTTTCTFSNTKDGAIQLVKNTTGGDATFPFTHSIAGLAPSLTTVSGTAADTSDSLTPGSGYAISEGDLPAGWAFTSAACELQGGGTTGTVTGKNITAITVEAGKTTTCTFSNTKDGAIQLVKNTTGGDATFPFTHSIAGLAPSLTTVSGTAADTSDSLTPGSGYAISEGDLPAGWAFTSAACELQGGGTTGTVTGKNITAITVEAGKTTTCTFSNTKDATVRIVKEANPEGAQLFDFALDGSDWGAASVQLKDDGASDNFADYTFVAGEFGTKSITETVPNGWTLTSASCAGTTGTPISDGVSFPVAAGDEITCTFTNVKGASLTIVKVTDPDDSGADNFDFTTSGSGMSNFTLDTDGGDDTHSNVEMFSFTPDLFGPKSVTEGATDGWSLTDVTCDDGSDQDPNTGSGATATVDIAAGVNITCTFTNVQDAKVRIVKEATPQSEQLFDFDLTGSGTFGPDLDLKDNGTDSNYEDYTFSAGEFGTKTITETVPDGWSLTGASCTGVDESEISDGVSFAVAAGDDIECTFTNVQDAKVRIVKEATPQSEQLFDFDLTGSGTFGPDLDLKDNGTDSNYEDYTFSAGEFGTKTITETVPDGWSLTGASCTGVDESEISDGVSFAVAAGDDIECTFTNVQDAKVRIVKEATPQSEQLFDFDLTGSGTFGPDLDLKDNGTDSNYEDYTFSAGEFGTKTITETVPDGWSLTGASCTGVDESEISDGVSFAVAAGDDIECTFTNVQDAKVRIVKEATPQSEQLFDFDLTGSGTFGPDLDLKDNGTDPNYEDYTFSAGEFGTKTITETVPDGWSLTGASCTGVDESEISDGVSFAVAAGDDIECTFTNVQDAKVRIVKEATPQSEQLFDFDLTGSGTFGPDLDLKDNGTDSNYEDYTFSAGEFGTKTITETVPDGWSLTGASCTGVDESEISDGVSFAVAAGDDIECTFTNVQDAKVRIVKEATPQSEQLFDFDLTGSGTFGPDLDLKDNGTDPNYEDYTFSAGEFGTKTITETVPDGWSLTGASCTGVDESEISDGVSFAVAAGDDIECTFTNVQDAKVRIVKEATPQSEQLFDFDLTGSGTFGPDLDLKDNGTDSNYEDYTFSAGEFGTKTITETVPDGWSLTGASCTGVDESEISDGVSFAVAAGDDIECTFTNVQDAKVRIVKEATPQSEQLFDFDLTGSGTFGPDLDLKDNGTDSNYEDYTFSAGEFGTKTITETVPDGWSLTGASCTGVDESEISDGVSFAVAAGDDIECTFTNVQDATLTIKKVTAPADAGDTTFGFTGTGDGMSNFTLDTNAGNATNPDQKTFTFSGTNYGSKSVTENAVAGWVLDGIFCEGAEDTGTSPTATVDVQPGDDITCTFTNKLAVLEIVKTARPASYSKIGDVITYGIIATNPGPATLTNVVVQDLFPGGLEGYVCKLNGVGDPLVGPVSVLQPKAFIECTAKHTVTQADLDKGSVYNQACVSSDEIGPICDDVTVHEITVDLIKDVTPDAPQPGPSATFTYTLTIHNTSVVPVTITSLTDTYEDQSPDYATTCGALVGQTLAATDGVVGGPDTLSCSYIVEHSTPELVFTNIGTVVVTDKEGTTATDTDTETVGLSEVETTPLPTPAPTESLKPTNMLATTDTTGPGRWRRSDGRPAQLDDVARAQRAAHPGHRLDHPPRTSRGGQEPLIPTINSIVHHDDGRARRGARPSSSSVREGEGPRPGGYGRRTTYTATTVAPSRTAPLPSTSVIGSTGSLRLDHRRYRRPWRPLPTLVVLRSRGSRRLPARPGLGHWPWLVGPLRVDEPTGHHQPW